MLQVVLLAGKFVFLAILYAFIWRVVRVAMRDLKSAAPVPSSGSSHRWVSEVSAEETGAVSCARAGPESSSGGPSNDWALVVEKSPCLTKGTSFRLPEGGRVLVGRSSEMDLTLEDTFVSSKHALFEALPAGLVVEDLRSTNGTQVNGRSISEPVVLRPGDRVEIGDTVFRVEVG